MKTFTNYEYFTESRIRITPPPHPLTRLAATQRELWASIQPLKMLTVNHPLAMKSNTITRFKIDPRLAEQFLRIIGGFLYAATSSLKRVTERIFTISKCFHRSKPKLYHLIAP
jgi:hypothetical protein